MDIAELQEVTSSAETRIAQDFFVHLDGYKRIPRTAKKRSKKKLSAPLIQKGYEIMSKYFGI